MLNQNINDLCTEMDKEKRADWLKVFDEWTINKKCPFIKVKKISFAFSFKL